jgi:3-phosphoshikimate 1-carboxyvinyltransferase
MTVVRVDPRREPLSAVVTVPGSKSVANRALVCAALADGRSTLDGVAPGDDTAAMVDCLALLGIGVGFDPWSASATVEGCGGRPVASFGVVLPTRLAGTTSRFVTAVAALADTEVVIDGMPPLRRRPMTPLHDALLELGATVEPGETWGHLPVRVRGPLRHGASIEIRGDVSSQYLTALMLIGPYLDGIELVLTTPLVSRPYLAITAAVMEQFGVEGVELDEHRVVVPAGRYTARHYVVEPDASSASYPLAAAAVVGGAVHVPGLTPSSLQGDAGFAHLLADMGCDVTVDHMGTTVRRDGPLRGIDVDMADLSDLVPSLAVVAPFAVTATTIRGVGFIRAKESDRLGDLAGELRRAGVAATDTDDGLVVRPGHPHGARFETHHDHRLAMSLALLGLVTDDVEIDDAEVVSKSWPGYWEMLEQLT